MIRGRDNEQAAIFRRDLFVDAAPFSTAVIARPHGLIVHAKIAFEQIEFLNAHVFVTRIVRSRCHPHDGGRVAARRVIEQNFEEYTWKRSRSPDHFYWARDQHATFLVKHTRGGPWGRLRRSRNGFNKPLA